MRGTPPDWSSPLTTLLRRAYMSWEFWVPPLLAVVAIGAMMWTLSANQDLLRQRQIDAAGKVQVEQVTAKIQALTSEVRELRDKVQVNTQDVREVKESIGP